MSSARLQIEPISAFEDNYIWLLTADPGCAAAVVDPGDEDPVIDRLRERDLRLEAVLITHHHGDHTGGVEGLAAAYPGLRVYGPKDRRIPEVTHPVGEGDRLLFLEGAVSLQVLAVPGHTASHIAYRGEGCLFCGDTLFAAGCGRVFDGSFEDLAASLRRIAALPGETLVYCAHEYTLANLGFARWVEPERAAIAERTEEVRRLRAAGRPSVPARLELERETNPFLRTSVPAVVAAAQTYAGCPLADETAVFTALRQWKDRAYD